jgi:hypothetical protein
VWEKTAEYCLLKNGKILRVSLMEVIVAYYFVRFLWSLLWLCIILNS